MAQTVTDGDFSVCGSQEQASAIAELFALQIFPTLVCLLKE
jgi:hypothetical protein